MGLGYDVGMGLGYEMGMGLGLYLGLGVGVGAGMCVSCCNYNFLWLCYAHRLTTTTRAEMSLCDVAT